MGAKILKDMINDCSHGYTEGDVLEDEEVENIDMVDVETSAPSLRRGQGNRGSGSHYRNSLSSMHGIR
jgi:hypothetical protein